MNPSQTHLDPAELRDLIRDKLPADRQEDVVRHLDECSECQAQLESLAGGGQVAAQLGERPARDSAYWPAMQSLQVSYGADDLTPKDQVTVLDPTQPSPPGGASLPLGFLSPSDEPGMLGKLGTFNIVEIIGQGGMGVVLKAWDGCLERHVAIKVLDPKVAQNDVALERFCREARAAAAITHENVVALFQVVHDEGKDLPYLVMQFVAGETLQDRLDKLGSLETVEIVRIGAQLAAGLAAAHAKGLIHRDIKPANILLEEGTGHVRLTDFGLARAAEDVKLTQTGFVAGTPLFMAPEQAQGHKVDHRTDLFSLGSVLYAMCTGNPPFAGSTPFVVLKSVTEETPKPVREINPMIPDWLEEVIERLHAKKPDDRLQSAADLAGLFRQKLVELQASAPRQRTSTPPVRAVGTRRATRGLILWARIGQILTALLALLAVTELVGWTKLLNRRGAGSPEVVVSPQHVRTLNANVGPIWAAAFSPDGKSLLTGIEDGAVKIWDVEAGRVKATLNAHGAPVWTVVYNEKGDRFASASDDGAAKVWDSATNKELHMLKHDADSGVKALAFSPDGTRIVTGTRNGKLIIWDAQTGDVFKKTRGHLGTIMSLAYSRDGKTIASASGDKSIKLWDAGTLQEQLTLTGHTGSVYSVAISPDGKTIASGSWDRTVRLWDADTGNLLRSLSGHSQDVWSVAFAPDGATLASVDDRTVKIWETATGREVVTLRGHLSTVHTVTYSRSGDLIASGGREGAVMLWRAR